MNLFWKMRKTSATGGVLSSAAASLSGWRLPEPKPPEASVATPVVRVSNLGLCADGALGPVPYPATCRPQAWSAAAAVVLLQAVLGIEVDASGTVLEVSGTLHVDSD